MLSAWPRLDSFADNSHIVVPNVQVIASATKIVMPDQERHRLIDVTFFLCDMTTLYVKFSVQMKAAQLYNNEETRCLIACMRKSAICSSSLHSLTWLIYPNDVSEESLTTQLNLWRSEVRNITLWYGMRDIGLQKYSLWNSVPIHLVLLTFSNWLQSIRYFSVWYVIDCVHRDGYR